MRKWLLVIMMFVVSGCSKNVPEQELRPAQSAIKMIVASDLHYISPSLIADRGQFAKLIQNGDGKVSQYSEEILEAFVQQVMDAHPDVLILSGDLTFNGEKVSHEGLAAKLIKLREAGINVLSIPGNHDINNYNARKFNTYSYDPVESVTPEAFAKIYGQLGYESLEQDKDSLSYFTMISEDFGVLMLDSNKYINNSPMNPSESSGYVSEKSLSWIEGVLKNAQEAGVTVLAVSHHNILCHHEGMCEGFTIDRPERLRTLLKNYDVKVALSGHIHTQSILKNDDIAEIVTESLSLTPIQYGVIDVDADKAFTYRTDVVDVSKWASENGRDDASLLNFNDFTRAFFDETSRRKFAQRFADSDLPEEEKEPLLTAFIALNRDFFSGKKDISLDDLAWDQFAKLPFKSYVELMQSKRSLEMNYLTINLK